MVFRRKAKPKSDPRITKAIERKKTIQRLTKQELDERIKAQSEFVGEASLAKRVQRTFSTIEILNILREYGKLSKAKGIRSAWLFERNLTTAHIAIWRKRLREGKLE
jgi:hypothetical protein